MDAKRISAPNNNNVLALDVFATIHFAPDRSKMPVWSVVEKQVFALEHDGITIFCQLEEVALYQFRHVPTTITLLTDGLHADAWRAHWLLKHPGTQPTAPMAVYYYKKQS